jgi:hypothetical protein
MALLEVLDSLPAVKDDVTLVPLFRGIWRLNQFVPIPDGPSGTRVIVTMPEGRLVGRGITATTTDGANADWLVIGPDGTGTADARGSVTTDDGAVIYLYGNGRCDLSNGFGTGAVLIGSASFETSDDRYRWLNKVHAIYRGTVVGDGMSGEATFHDEYFEVR